MLLFCWVMSMLIGGTTPPQTVPLWKNGAPGFEPRRNEPERLRGAWIQNINNPSLTVYLPPGEKRNGTAVVIVPGGGMRELAFNAEGRDSALFLNKLGITAFVLKYRLAHASGSPYKVEPHVRQDVSRAMRLVRSRAKEWHIDPQRVGMLGYSAGGEVISLVAYSPAPGDPRSPDPVDRLNARPNFVMLVYPSFNLRQLPKPLPPDAPPAFLAVAREDQMAVGVLEMLQRYYDARIPVEAHIYAHGDHLFFMGYGSKFATLRHWPQHMADWLADSGYLKKK